MTQNINTIINALHQFQANHLELKRFKCSFFEQFDNFSTSGDSFPILYAIPNEVSFEENIDVQSFRVYCVDILQKDRSNEQYILNDTLLVLRDLTNWLREGDNGLNILNIPRAIPVNNFLVDFTCGWYIDIDIECEAITTECAIPFSSNFVLTGTTCDIGYVNQYLTCDTLASCQTIIDIEGDITNIYSILSGTTGQTTYQYWTSGSTGYQSIKANNDSGLDSTGDYSVAEGASTLASGFASHSEGSSTIASGLASHAEGNSSQSIGDSSHSEGDYTIASGYISHAEGNTTKAIGDISHAEGNETQAISESTHTEGYQTTAGAKAYLADSIVNGLITVNSSYGASIPLDTLIWINDENDANVFGTIIKTIQSITFNGTNLLIQIDVFDDSIDTNTCVFTPIGFPNEANADEGTGLASHSEGDTTIAIGDASHAEGFETIAGGNNSHAEGNTTIAGGNNSHSEGINTIASGNASHSEGNATQASGEASHSEGLETKASGYISHAEGFQSTSSGNYSHTEGYTTTASGSMSHAEGAGSVASGQASHAEGQGNLASSFGSHAEGFSSAASGYVSHAEGGYTTASGGYSHTEGYYTTANRNYAHAGGINTIASGQTSFVHGSGSTAGGNGTVVLGNGITGLTDNTTYVDAININTNTLKTTAEVGTFYWNNTDGTANLKLKGGNVTLQIGQEMVTRVVNKTATNITLQEANYQVVKIIGATGQRLSVDLAQANNDVNSVTTLGLVTENILNNQEGFITTNGRVNEINTTGSLQGETWIDGDVLYLSPTIAGQLTNIKPVAPNHLVTIGYVEYAHNIHGKIYVKIDNGYELDELHNVLITTPANNEVLMYNSTSSLWENKDINTVIKPTPTVNLFNHYNFI